MSLDTVRVEADGLLYPRDRLEGLTTALMGFCAAFLGRQDCVWVADAGLTGTGVDIDQERLDEMVGIYPDDWTFVCADIFEFAQRCLADGTTYDLVSLDPPTNFFDRIAATVELWCGLATRLVVLGAGAGTVIETPPRWNEQERMHRSTRHGTYWAVLERPT